MKKTFKKLFAALLAAALVLAMAVPAFAETNATKGSITINNTVKGETYTIYRMFKLDSYNAESNTYSYTVESAWENFFKTGAGKDYIDLTNGHPTWKTGVDSTDDSDTVAALAKAALAWAKVKGITGTAETATGDTVTFSGLDLGYYLVDSSLGALCGLNTTNPDATIKEKNGQPTIEKKVKNHNNDWVDENTAKIGDTVEYKVEIKVADGAQKYTVTDTMSKGLTFNSGSLKVTANGAQTTNYTLTPTENGFTLELPESYVSNLAKDTVIIVTYNATLNKDAVIDGDGNTNEVKLSYGNQQNTVPSKVTTKSCQFDLVKVDGTTNKLLDGAKFKLYDAKDSVTPIKVVPVAGGYRVANGNEPSATETIAVTDGKVHISGLDKTTYWLEETKAPDGYNMLTERKPVDLTNGSNNTTLTSDTWSEADHGVAVENNAGTVLPSTGGMGTTLFYVIGGGLMVAAVVLLVTKKRMEHKN